MIIDPITHLEKPTPSIPPEAATNDEELNNFINDHLRKSRAEFDDHVDRINTQLGFNPPPD